MDPAYSLIDDVNSALTDAVSEKEKCILLFIALICGECQDFNKCIKTVTYNSEPGTYETYLEQYKMMSSSDKKIVEDTTRNNIARLRHQQNNSPVNEQVRESVELAKYFVSCEARQSCGWYECCRGYGRFCDGVYLTIRESTIIPDLPSNESWLKTTGCCPCPQGITHSMLEIIENGFDFDKADLDRKFPELESLWCARNEQSFGVFSHSAVEYVECSSQLLGNLPNMCRLTYWDSNWSLSRASLVANNLRVLEFVQLSADQEVIVADFPCLNEIRLYHTQYRCVVSTETLPSLEAFFVSNIENHLIDHYDQLKKALLCKEFVEAELFEENPSGIGERRGSYNKGGWHFNTPNRYAVALPKRFRR